MCAELGTDSSDTNNAMSPSSARPPHHSLIMGTHGIFIHYTRFYDCRGMHPEMDGSSVSNTRLCIHIKYCQDVCVCVFIVKSHMVSNWDIWPNNCAHICWPRSANWWPAHPLPSCPPPAHTHTSLLLLRLSIHY